MGFAKDLMSLMRDKDAVKELTDYRRVTIFTIFALYGDGTEDPPSPQFAQTFAMQACSIVKKMRENGTTPENKTAITLLYDTVQTAALNVILDPSLRRMCKRINLLTKEDQFDPGSALTSDSEDDEGSDDDTSEEEDDTEEELAGSLDSVALDDKDKTADT